MVMDDEKIKETEEEKAARLKKEKEERQKYKAKMKIYEKRGALFFQKVVFKVEKLKFLILKNMFPNFLNYYEKYIDRKKNKKIECIKRKACERENIEKNYPKLLKIYDKYCGFKEKTINQIDELKETVRKKVKAINPKIIDFYDDYLKEEDPLKGLESKEKIRKLIELTKYSKMFMRKEFYQEKNRNYHIDPKTPTAIYEYLKWNKKIHVRGMLKNAVTIPITIVFSLVGFEFLLPLLLYELVSLGINFECVNIQNYSICRYKITEKVLKKQEKLKIDESIKNYGSAQELITKSIVMQDDLPKLDDIITNNATNIDQLRILRKLIQDNTQERILLNNRRKSI